VRDVDTKPRRHPLKSASPRARGAAALVLVALVAAGSAWMNSMLPGVPGADRGIVSFELARTPARATEIVDAWRAAERIDDARLQLWIDYGYMVAYGLLVSIGCLWSHDRLRSASRKRAARAAQVLAWGIFAAVAFDAAENTLLFAVLRHPSSRAIGFATAAATAKFVLLFAAIGLIAWGAISAAADRLRHRSAE